MCLCGSKLEPANYACYRYNIVRHYYRGGHRVIARGLSLEQAQAHCSSEDTHTGSGASAKARRVTRRNGPFFDGYSHE